MHAGFAIERRRSPRAVAILGCSALSRKSAMSPWSGMGMRASSAAFWEWADAHALFQRLRDTPHTAWPFSYPVRLARSVGRYSSMRRKVKSVRALLFSSHIWVGWVGVGAGMALPSLLLTYGAQKRECWIKSASPNPRWYLRCKSDAARIAPETG